MRVDPKDIALCVSGPDVDPSGPQSTSPPITQTSLFTFPTFAALLEGLGDEYGTTVYSRGRNPTVQALERKLATLERGESCSCFASGMGAISAVLLGLLKSGDHILFVNQIYGPTLQLANHLSRFGISFDVVLGLSPDNVRKALRPETAMVWMESPGTMLFRMLDVEAIADVARAHGAVSCLDNSWATPLLQKPIELGVDIVVHSATKYLGGHSDVVAGVVVSTEELSETIFYRSYLLNGASLVPFDAWLLLRGLRTLPARLREHEAAALRVADALRNHTEVRHVHHPAFGDQTLVDKQLKGFSGLLSFELKRDNFEAISTFIDNLEYFRIGVSWGGVESLAISPQRQSAWPLPHPMELPSGMVRISVGLEGANTLAADLTQSLDRLS